MLRAVLEKKLCSLSDSVFPCKKRNCVSIHSLWTLPTPCCQHLLLGISSWLLLCEQSCLILVLNRGGKGIILMMKLPFKECKYIWMLELFFHSVLATVPDSLTKTPHMSFFMGGQPTGRGFVLSWQTRFSQDPLHIYINIPRVFIIVFKNAVYMAVISYLWEAKAGALKIEASPST